MDFSQVKAIEIPEGSVKQITDSQGRRIWHTPTLYRELEYIENNSNEYLQCKWVNLNAGQIEFKYKYLSGTQTNNSPCLGVTDGTNQYVFWTNCRSGVNNISCNYGTTALDASSDVDFSNDIVVKLIDSGNNKSFIVNDETVQNVAKKTATIQKNFFVFDANNNGSPYNRGRKFRFYYVKFTADIVTNTVDLVPAQRKSDNKIGMYDKNNGVFYTDARGGNFIAGPTADEYPDWSE